MVNTNNIISTITEDLQNTIDMHQKNLDTIKESFSKAQEFLLNNDVSEINNEDDILKEVMKCIKSLKSQINANNLDIDSINKSLTELKNLSCGIDESVTKTLVDKIDIIDKNNTTCTDKIEESKNFLEVLLKLEIVCPACNGKKNKNCEFCNTTRIVSVAKLLENENLLEVDYIDTDSYNTQNNNYDYYSEYEESYQGMSETSNTQNSSNSNKFVISKKK